MTVVSYNKELEIANLQFRKLFSNITIYRNTKKVKFEVSNENRSRILKNLENPGKNAEYTLPLITIVRTGIAKNDDRITNINNEIKYRTVSTGKIDPNLLAPVPIDISDSVTILSKYQSDIDMCMSNFIPFFNKDLFVRCEHPKFKDIEYTSQVVMDGNISEEHPADLEPTQDDIVTATCNFTFKTYIFGGTGKTKTEHTSSVVSTYVSSYISTDYDEGLSMEISSEVSTEVSAIVDTKYEGFVPTIDTIHMGFYPVPLLSQYVPHMDWVDALCAEGQDDSDYVDRLIWKIDENTGVYYQEPREWTPVNPVLSGYIG